MRHALWLILIAFSISALSGGFFSGRAAVPHFGAAARGAGTAPPPSLPDLTQGVPQTDEIARDEFAGDEAVSLDTPGGNARDDARLAFVLVDAGHSAALESPFLSLSVPVTLVIDPRGAAAGAMVKLAHHQGDAIYLQAHAPLTAGEVAALRKAYPDAQGVAVRMPGAPLSESAAAALRANALALLDEYGESAPGAAPKSVRFAARSVTVDDHAQRTYVAYMLRQAVHLARGRRAVVMARPFPGTLQAFQDLLTHASREGIRFVGLP